MGTAQAIAQRGGTALLAMTTVLVVGTAAWPAVLVLGDDVTSAGDAAVALLGCGLSLLLLARVIGRRDRRRFASRPEEPVEHVPRRWARGRRLAVGLLVVGAGGATTFAWAFDAGSDAVVLSPSSTNGCRVVVQERSFLLAGSGTVLVLAADGLVARQVSRYTTDDGYRPVRAGSFSLTWTGERGHLEVFGSGFDPVWPRGHEIDCSGG